MAIYLGGQRLDGQASTDTYSKAEVDAAISLAVARATLGDPAALKAAADSVAASGESSAYWPMLKALMDADHDFVIPLATSETSVEADKCLHMRIVGINQKSKAGGGLAGVTLQARRSMPVAKQLNSTGSATGGYPAMTDFRSYLNQDVLAMLPASWQSVIEEVTNTSYGPSGSQVTSSDKVWVASHQELKGNGPGSYDSGDGPQFQFWAAKGVTDASYSALAGMDVTNSGANPSGRSGAYWCTRSVYPGNTASFVLVNSTGGWSYSYPSVSCGVVPCFSL